MLDGESFKVEGYTTNTGKELRGAWVPTQAMALKFSPGNFQKKPLGWFVRERNFLAAEGNVAREPGGSLHCDL